MIMNYKYVDDSLKEKIIGYRRDFHRNPESCWTEFRTSCVIAEVLERLGFEIYVGKSVCASLGRSGMPDEDEIRERFWEVRTQILEGMMAWNKYLDAMNGGYTGVIGILNKGMGNPIGFRFDIDALKVQETDLDKDYVSQREGVMHACGHDAHAAAGLGLAHVLSENKELINREVRFIFQPAEEGCGGSRAIVNNGWLDDVREFHSGHVGLKCRVLGQVAPVRAGILATTKFNIRFHGVATHAAHYPNQGKNALLTAAEFAVKVFELAAEIPDVKANVGKLVSGSGRNIISDNAYLECETRGKTTEANHKIRDEILKQAEIISQKHGTTYDVEFLGEADSSETDVELAEKGRLIAGDMGIGEFYIPEGFFGASEDVTTMMNRVKEKGGKAALYMFGTDLSAEHHQGSFDIDEEVLAIMTEFYARTVLG